MAEEEEAAVTPSVSSVSESTEEEQDVKSKSSGDGGTVDEEPEVSVGDELSEGGIGGAGRFQLTWHTPRFERLTLSGNTPGEEKNTWRVVLSWEWCLDDDVLPDSEQDACTLYMRRNLEPWEAMQTHVVGRTAEVDLGDGDQTRLAHYFFLRPHGEQVEHGQVLGPLVPPPVPGPVRGIHASEVAPGVISISWEPPAVPSLRCMPSPVIDYEVLLENERQQQALAVSSGTRLIVTGVDPNHCYTVQVCALNEAGRGPYSIATRSVDIRGTRRRVLPLDGCAYLPWRVEELAPIPAEKHYCVCLSVCSRIAALLATVALDAESSIVFCYKNDRPLVLAAFMSAYMVFALMATRISEGLEAWIPPIVSVLVAKFIAIAAILLFHMHACTDGFTNLDVLHAFERPVVKVCKTMAEYAPPGIPGVLTQGEIFQILLRAFVGGAAATVRHVSIHVVWPDPPGGGALAIFEEVLLCKCAPLGFLILALMIHLGLEREASLWILARCLVLQLLVSALAAPLLGPFCGRAAVALIRHKVSMLVLMRQFFCFCEAEARRAVGELLPVGEGINAQVYGILHQWGGAQRPVWIWSGRTRSLLQDFAPLLGLRDPGALIGLGALLRRHLMGAEREVVGLVEAVRQTKRGRLTGTHALLSRLESSAFIDLLTVAAAAGPPPRKDAIALAVSQSVQRQRLLYNVGELHAALLRIRKRSALAVPNESLATTLVVAITSERSWLSCLGCCTCCGMARLQERLCIDKSIYALHVRDEENKDRARRGDGDAWRGSCPSWASVVAVVGRRGLEKACGDTHEAWLLALLQLTELEPAEVVPLTAEQKEQARRGSVRIGTEKEHQKEIDELAAISSSLLQRHGCVYPVAEADQLEKQCAQAVHAFGSSVIHAFGSEHDSSLGYALICMLRGVCQEGCDTAANLSDGFHMLTTRLLRDVGAKDAGKSVLKSQGDKMAAKRAHMIMHRARRLVVAVLRSKYLAAPRTNSSAHELYVLASEWHIFCSGARLEDSGARGREAFSLEDRNFCLDVVHRIFYPDAFPPHSEAGVRKAAEAVVALSSCEPEPLTRVLSKLLAEVDTGGGMTVALRVVALVAWLDGEVQELAARHWQMKKSDSSLLDDIAVITECAATDVLALNASLALGFRTSKTLRTAQQAANIIGQQWGLCIGSDMKITPQSGELCLGSVLRLLHTIGGEEGPQMLLSHLVASAAQTIAWMPLLMLVNDDSPQEFMGAIAAGGGDSVPWAATSKRSEDEAGFMRLLAESLVRVTRMGMLPAPPIIEPRRPFPDDMSMVLEYLGRHGNGLLSPGDAVWLLETVSRAACDELTYAETCTAFGSEPAVGMTVGTAKLILETVDDDVKGQVCQTAVAARDEMIREFARMTKQRVVQVREIEGAVREACGLTHSLELWLTHFFGVRSDQGGQEAGVQSDLQGGPADILSIPSSGLRAYFSWRNTQSTRRRVASLRGILALQGRPNELSRSWRAAAERGAIPREANERGEVRRLLPKKKSFLKRFRSMNWRPDANELRILPYAVGTASADKALERQGPTPVISERGFRHGFCHSRTVMARGGLDRREARNLSALHYKAPALIRAVYGWFSDAYIWPGLVYLVIVAVLESELFVLVPACLFHGAASDSEVVLACLISGIVFCALQLGQVVGAVPQMLFIQRVERCRLPASPLFVASSQQKWEQMALLVAIVSMLGSALWRISAPLLSTGRVDPLNTSLFVLGAFLFGVCRPLVEAMLLLRPRRGHSDGRRGVPSPNMLYVIRTVTTAVSLPICLTTRFSDWCRQFQVFAAALLPEYWALWLRKNPTWNEDLAGQAGFALTGLGAVLYLLPLLAMVPWTASANWERLYAHPLRRALHFSQPYGGEGHGGPPVEGKPVVKSVSSSFVKLSWFSPPSTRHLTYSIEASFEYGDWLPAEAVKTVWPQDRRLPRCWVPVSSFPLGRTVRFRVRCAPAPHPLDEEGAPLLWGPWSLASLPMRRPSGLRLPFVLRPIFLLAFAPLSIADYLVVSLPRAWLNQFNRKGGVKEDKSIDSLFNRIVLTPSKIWLVLPLLAIIPLVLAHVIFWRLPRSALRAWSSRWNFCLRALCMFILLPVLPIFFVFNILHGLCRQMRQARQVEMVHAMDMYGPLLHVRVHQDAFLEDTPIFANVASDPTAEIRSAIATSDELLGNTPIDLASFGYAPKLNVKSGTEVWIEACDNPERRLKADSAEPCSHRLRCSVAAGTSVAGFARILGAPIVVMPAASLVASSKESFLTATIASARMRTKLRNTLLLLTPGNASVTAVLKKSESWLARKKSRSKVTPSSSDAKDEVIAVDPKEVYDAAVAAGVVGILVVDRRSEWLAAATGVIPCISVEEGADVLQDALSVQEMVVASLVSACTESGDGDGGVDGGEGIGRMSRVDSGGAADFVHVAWELSDERVNSTGFSSGSVWQRSERRVDVPVLALQEWRRHGVARDGRENNSEAADFDAAVGTWSSVALIMGSLTRSVRAPLLSAQGPCCFRMLARVRGSWQPISDRALWQPESMSAEALACQHGEADGTARSRKKAVTGGVLPAALQAAMFHNPRRSSRNTSQSRTSVRAPSKGRTSSKAEEGTAAGAAKPSAAAARGAQQGQTQERLPRRSTGSSAGGGQPPREKLPVTTRSPPRPKRSDGPVGDVVEQVPATVEVLATAPGVLNQEDAMTEPEMSATAIVGGTGFRDTAFVRPTSNGTAFGGMLEMSPEAFLYADRIRRGQKRFNDLDWLG